MVMDGLTQCYEIHLTFISILIFPLIHKVYQLFKELWEMAKIEKQLINKSKL